MKYKSGYKYILDTDFTYQTRMLPLKPAIIDQWVSLSPSGVLHISKGYAWDGASGPVFDTKTVMRASLVHDALYQLMREEVLDARWLHAANDELYRICLADGMSKFRAWYIHQGVEWFGHYFIIPHIPNVVILNHDQ